MGAAMGNGGLYDLARVYPEKGRAKIANKKPFRTEGFCTDVLEVELKGLEPLTSTMPL